MKGMPFNFGGKGVSVPVPEIGEGKWKKVNNEPTSVLDTHRSPSPTSTSTLSSSFGGGGGSSTDTAGGVAAVSGHQPQKWPASGEPTKDEWPAELVGSGKCGVAMDEWDNMMIETVGAPEPQDNSLFRWMVGEMDDPLKIPQGGGSANQVNGVGGGSCGGGGGGCGGTVSFDGPVEPGFSVDSATYGFGSSFIDPSCNGVVFPVNSLLGGFSSAPKFGSCSGGGAATSVGAGNVSLFAPSTNLSLPLADLSGIFCQQQPEPPLLEEKPHIHPFMNSAASNLGFYLQEVPVIPPAKRHQSAGLDQEWAPPPPSQALPFPPLVKQEMQIPHSNKVAFSDSGQELFLRPHKLKQQQQQPMSLLQQHQQQRPRSMPDSVYGPGSDDAALLAIMDQLHRAAELSETGNSVHARAILARLNHHLSSPVGKPLHRAAFYFKEALFHVLGTRNGAPPVQGVNPAIAPPVFSPSDVVLRIGAYKAFCEISPLVQFASLTCNQALLEILNGPSAIHILDFDIGIGGHWASFMQEIAPKIDGTHSLKITAFISPSSHNELELALTKENLSNFARLLNIPFEFNAVILDSFDPSVCNLRSPNQVLVANLPLSSRRFFSSSSLPSLLQFVRQLSPKLVVSSDNACDRTDLPFSQHFLHGLQFYSLLFDSLDAMNVNPNTLRKVEGLLLKPKIESLVASWYHAAEKLPPWRNLFISAGFTPVALSNYTQIQAECLIKRLNLRGFHVEKHQASLLLLWQRQELATASVWTC